MQSPEYGGADRVGAVQDLTDEQFESLRSLVAASREDLARSMERIEAVRSEIMSFKVDIRNDVTRLIGQLDSMAAVVERHGTRLDLLEQWKGTFTKEVSENQHMREAQRRALVGWIIAGVGVMMAAVEWVISMFSVVPKR